METETAAETAAETETETETETELQTGWYLERGYLERHLENRYLKQQYLKRRYLKDVSPAEPLAVNRTWRVDPLQHFQFYEDGWDPSSKYYWASVAWAGIYGLIMGAAWIVIGISILAFALCACLFCRKRWKERLDGDPPGYTRFQIRVPLGALVLAAALILVGVALLLTGGVQFQSTYRSATQFALGTTQALVSATHNLSAALQRSANTTVFNAVVPPATQQAVLQGAVHADVMATDIQARIVNSIDQLDGYVKIVTITILVIGSLTALLVLLGLVAGFMQWLVASHILVSVIWAMGFITWCTVTLCLLSTLFAGDTSAAMWQVSQQDPVGNSTMQQWLPCARASDVRQAINTTVTAISASNALLNTSIATTYPQLLTALNATGICNPYAGGSTELSYDVTSCPPGTLPPAAFLQSLVTTLPCTNGTCQLKFPNGTVMLLQVPPAALSDLQTASAALTHLVDSVPVLLQIANCTYVKEICEHASGMATDMERDFNMLWCGFIVISVASMLLALALPVYIFRSAHPQADPLVHSLPHLQTQQLALPPGESSLSSPPRTPPLDRRSPPCDGPASAASDSAGAAADGMPQMEDLQLGEERKDQSTLARCAGTSRVSVFFLSFLCSLPVFQCSFHCVSVIFPFFAERAMSSATEAPADVQPPRNLSAKPELGPLSSKILPHLFKLYDCTARDGDFEIYSPDAKFDDPLMSAHGLNQIKSAFYSMQVLFQEGRIVEYTLEETSTGDGSGLVVMDNKQNYKVWGRPFDVDSRIQLKVEGGKVVHHEDLWNKKPLWSDPSNGFMGWLGYSWRRSAMITTDVLMGRGKEPKGRA
ncbi:unnamed protein product [Closterium sp. NIES-54]